MTEGAPSEKKCERETENVSWLEWSTPPLVGATGADTKQPISSQWRRRRFGTSTISAGGLRIPLDAIMRLSTLQNGMLVGAQIHGPFDNFLVSVNPDISNFTKTLASYHSFTNISSGWLQNHSLRRWRLGCRRPSIRSCMPRPKRSKPCCR